MKRAAQLVEKNLSVERIVQEIEELIERIFIYVAVEDLTPMIRSGRIPKLIGEIAQKFDLYPIVSLDQEGRGKLIGVSFGRKQSMTKILKKVTALVKQEKVEELAVTHVLEDENVLWWKEALAKKMWKYFEVTEGSAVIAISAGAGSVAIAGILKEDV